MGSSIIRFGILVPGFIMFANTIMFLVVPARATASLGMPLLAGVARSTQLGDLTAFFTAATGFIFYGAWRMQPRWIYASAWLSGLAAAGRIVAWLAHDAPFATPLIGAECVIAAWLALSGYVMARNLPKIDTESPTRS